MDNIAEIEEWLEEHEVYNYFINDDYSVDVEGSVNLEGNHLTVIPVKFNRVTGLFSCADNRLVTLENCPREVGLSFHCCNNNIQTLKGCPNIIGDYIDCSSNRYLASLAFGPKTVKTNFIIGHNPVRSLDDFTTEFKGKFAHEIIKGMDDYPFIEGFEQLYQDREYRKRLILNYDEIHAVLNKQKLEKALHNKLDIKNALKTKLKI
jgi:hypothetical protein